MIGVLWGGMALLLVISALLSSAETATFAVGDSGLRTLKEEGFRRADTLSRLRSHPEALRATLFVLNALLNFSAAGVGVAAATLTWGTPGAVAGVPLSALLVLFLAEILPRAVVGRRPVRVALLSAPVLFQLDRLLGPTRDPLIRLEGILSGRNGEEESTPGEREVRELAELGQEEGVVGEEEHLLVERAFRLDELRAWDVMTPRVDIFSWKDSLTLDEIIDDLEGVPYSRIPVHGDTVDDVTGILYIREAYETYVSGRTGTPLSEISREPFFVPGSLPLTRLLRDFQARRIHMGIVADEFGGTDGLVTLEDILEELVGDIVDETDVDEEPFTRLSRTEVVVDAGLDLREINYSFNVSLPQLEHRSLNGFILEELGYVPQKGEIMERDGVRIEILDATDTQVLRVRLEKASAVTEESED